MALYSAARDAAFRRKLFPGGCRCWLDKQAARHLAAAASSHGSSGPFGTSSSSNRRVPKEEGSSGIRSAFDMELEDLAKHAKWLAREYRKGAAADPVELERAWAAVAFQAEGHAAELSTSDRCSLLRAMSSAGVLGQHESASEALLKELQSTGAGQLKQRRLISLWAALDRCDITSASQDGDRCGRTSGELARAFLRGELPRVVAAAAAWSGRATEDSGGRAADSGAPEGAETDASSEREWRRLLAFMEASGCGAEELRPTWDALEAAALREHGGAMRVLSIDGLVHAARCAGLAEARAGCSPRKDLVEHIGDRLKAQSKWLGGWAASHAVLASARMGLAPRQGYDPLRQALIERCPLEPGKFSGSGGFSWEQLLQAERVAAALVRFDVHDVEVRDRLSEWLLAPLPVDRFAWLAGALSKLGLNDAEAPKVARHVRARARASELRDSLGEERAEALQEVYAQ
eukprot:TRINITY_DN22805_c0_g1_i1.p1 TRINITY_DN22805_c0_g1~~TRINITY_DN22805_c0_g1_i1.p1  ORF type:complete len:462 (+),score=106.32 TRINITY_DN22805_c0_g1_i1:193-1578(+)